MSGRRRKEKIKAKKVADIPKEETKKELKISAIEEGTVIDHIPTDATFKVFEILDLENHKGIVSIATNLASKSIGKKGIVKVGGKSLTQEEVNKIAIVAPDATVNLIKSFEVKDIKSYDKERIRLSLTTISEVITDWAITREIEK